MWCTLNTEIRKHAPLIHAWAEGAKIQLRVNDYWLDVESPAFQETEVYRIKPEVRKYRMARMHSQDSGVMYFAIAQDMEEAEHLMNKCKDFVSWFSDWREIYVWK